MKARHVVLIAIFANVAGALIAQYLINNVSQVRRVTGGI